MFGYPSYNCLYEIPIPVSIVDRQQKILPQAALCLVPSQSLWFQKRLHIQAVCVSIGSPACSAILFSHRSLSVPIPLLSRILPLPSDHVAFTKTRILHRSGRDGHIPPHFLAFYSVCQPLRRRSVRDGSWMELFRLRGRHGAL